VIASSHRETVVIYKLNQTPPEKQIQEVAPCKSLPPNHHEERHFYCQASERAMENGNHSKINTNSVDLSHGRRSITIVETTNLSVSLSY